MAALQRMWVFTRFVLNEYLRSGRLLIEVVAGVAFWTLFLRQPQSDLHHFFATTGVFILLLTLYTTSSFLGLGERPQGYIVLTRPLGRRGYLLSHYLAAVLTVTATYTLIAALTRLAAPPFDWQLAEVLKGSLPLLLNVALLAALLVLLSSLVVSAGWRLVVLTLLAIALYSQAWHLWPGYRFIEPLQSLLSWPLYPPLAAFRLATTREFGGEAPYILLAQIALLILLLSLALSSFKRRDVILHAR